jgi:dynein heavy chain 1
MRKRSEKFIPVKVNSAHAKLQQRTTYLCGFRRTHEQLRIMTEPARGLKSIGSESLADLDMEDEVRLAYNSVKGVDVLDVSIGE